MLVNCVWEHHQKDSLIYANNVIGAFTRGATKEEALSKMPLEIRSFLSWAQEEQPTSLEFQIVQERATEVNVADADSEVIFDSELKALTREEYQRLKSLALRSAEDFLRLYEAFPDPNCTVLAPRKTFYGKRPCTASEMYFHTKNVNAYYWGEIGLEVANEGSILENRVRGFERLEAVEQELDGTVYEGSYGERWSLAKLLRRFIWHDRIHAKAMYRMGVKAFGDGAIPNIFLFV